MTMESKTAYRLMRAGRLLLFILAAIVAGAMCWIAAGKMHLPDDWSFDWSPSLVFALALALAASSPFAFAFVFC